MAELLSLYCPHCHKHTSLTPAPIEYEYAYEKHTTPGFWRKNSNEVWWIGICHSCGKPVLVKNRGDVVYPAPLPSPTEESIPEEIRNDLDEAKNCFAFGAFRACAVMARRAMQTAATDKGATADKLFKQVQQLQEIGQITVDLKDWADAVRWIGNDAAHPGGLSVEAEDAEDVLTLAEQFLHVLYVAPSLAAGLRAKRGKDKS